MRVLIATDNYYPNVNGASYSGQRHAYYLKQAGHDVVVVAPSRKFSDEVFEHEGITIYGFRSIPVERIRMTFFGMGKSAINKVVNDFNPDVVHILSHYNISQQAAQAGQRLGVPVVGTNHFMPENLVHYLPIGTRAQNYIKKLMWAHFLKTFNTLDAITSPSNMAAGLVQNVGVNQPVQVVSNGIDLTKFRADNSAGYLRQKYQIPDKPILLFVGRLDKEKNVDLVIRAMVQVVSMMNDQTGDAVPVQFVVAGSGAEMKNLIRLAEELGLEQSVTFTGFVPDEDMPGLFAISYCFVMAGNAELQSIATMEAMATGLPVIAMNATALPELVHHQENGILFEGDNVEEIAAAIIRVFGNSELREQMSKQSKQIVAPHDIYKVTQKFVDIYEGLLAKDVRKDA